MFDVQVIIAMDAHVRRVKFLISCRKTLTGLNKTQRKSAIESNQATRAVSEEER